MARMRPLRRSSYRNPRLRSRAGQRRLITCSGDGSAIFTAMQNAGNKAYLISLMRESGSGGAYHDPDRQWLLSGTVSVRSMRTTVTPRPDPIAGHIQAQLRLLLWQGDCDW